LLIYDRKGFASKDLVLDKNLKRGSFAREVDNRLGMVITRWKDSNKVLQTVNTVMIKGLTSITRRTDSKQTKVIVPIDKNYMGGVDRGDQHRVMCAGFSNVTNFKKWYKKAYLGIAKFSMLNAFSAGYTGVSGGIKTCVL